MSEEKIVGIARSVKLKRQLWLVSHPEEEKPKKLLLGKSQQAALIEEAESWGYFEKPSILFERTGSCRVEYQGLACYAVDDEDYCEVAP